MQQIADWLQRLGLGQYPSGHRRTEVYGDAGSWPVLLRRLPILHWGQRAVSDGHPENSCGLDVAPTPNTN